ncbi:MAG: TetR/AcrR family transcriptional regulator [Lachnospiraceae bacterium]
MMKGKGITMEGIVAAATELVIEKGYNNFSMRELAYKLHCKAASLYNHIKSIDDINREVGRYAAAKLNYALECSVEGKQRDAAIEAVAYAYRDFVKNNYQLYQAIMGMPELKQDESLILGRESVRVIRSIIAQYEITHEDAVNFSRCFRGALHGYTSFEMYGYYTSTNLTAAESFRFLIDVYIRSVNQMEAEHKAQA